MPACRWLPQACREEKAMQAARNGSGSVGLVLAVGGLETSQMRVSRAVMCVGADCSYYKKRFEFVCFLRHFVAICTGKRVILMHQRISASMVDG
jgi:hypothetical protein